MYILQRNKWFHEAEHVIVEDTYSQFSLPVENQPQLLHDLLSAGRAELQSMSIVILSFSQLLQQTNQHYNKLYNNKPVLQQTNTTTNQYNNKPITNQHYTKQYNNRPALQQQTCTTINQYYNINI